MASSALRRDFAPAPAPAARSAANDAGAAFSQLEHSVIAMARKDSLSTLAPGGGISERIGLLFGAWRSARLADPKLEALRRTAVLAWRRGYVIANGDLKAFLTAGFTLDHYELLQTIIGEARAKPRERLQ